MINSMLNFAKANYHVFPLLNRLKNKKNKLGTPIGWNHNKTNNKLAIKSTTDVFVINEWFNKYDDIIGFGINPRDKRALILDVDIGNNKVGDKSLGKLIKDFGLKSAELIIKSKSGGIHAYYEHPNLNIVGTTLLEYEHIDIRVSNNFVVGPDSFGGKYKIIKGKPSTILSKLPDKLIKILPIRNKSSIIHTPLETINAQLSFGNLVTEDKELISGEIPDSIKYGNRDNTLIKLIGSWVRSGISRNNIIVLTKAAIKVCETNKSDPIYIDEYIAKIDYTLGKETFSRAIPDSLQYFLNNLVYIKQHDAVYERPSKTIRMKGMINLYAPHKYYIENSKGKIKEVSTYKSWLKEEKRVNVESFGYHPNQDTILYDNIQKCDVVNTYSLPRLADKDFEKSLQCHTPNKDIYKTFLNFCLYMFAEKTDFMIDWAAHLVQRPEIKLGLAPVLVSEERGVGKNLFFDIMSAMVGFHNVATFNTERVTDPYNDYILRTHLVLVNESYIDIQDRWTRKNRNQLIEGIKSLITDSSQDVNPKFIIPFTAKSYVNYLFASNNLNAVPIDDKDRRFEIIIIEALKQPTQYYDNLWSIVRDERVAYYVRKELLKHKIKSLYRGVTASKVDEHKKMVIEANKSYSDSVISDTIESHDSVFKEDIIVYELFAWFVLEKVDPTMSLEQIRLLFRKHCKPIYLHNKKLTRQGLVKYPPLTVKNGFLAGGKAKKGFYTCRNFDLYMCNRDIEIAKLQASYNVNFSCTEINLKTKIV